MRKLLVALALLTAPAAAAHDFVTVDEYQDDFAKARECRPLGDGRRLWVGEEGYYVQSWFFMTGQSGILDDENASVVSFADNKPEDLTDWAALCR